MCGIAGIWNRDGRPVTPAAIERFTTALAHRGPDGAGTLIDTEAGLALGHRRLSILDPTAAGDQPMRCVDGRYWITFNGEIYNFLELRVQLEAAGYRFRSQTDTEIIAAAYDRWGERCQLAFNGMWAFALWDLRTRRLFISRDRFGVKPLYFHVGGSRVAFASELKAFTALDDFRIREDSASLARAIDDPLGAEAFEETPFAGVRRLLPGHSLSIAPGGFAQTRWWRTIDHLTAAAPSAAARTAGFRDRFFDAARVRLRSDVPIAVALSGGLDSSSVLATLGAIDGERGVAETTRRASWRHAFTATYAGTPLDERRFAETVACEVNVMLTDVPIRPVVTPDAIGRIVWDLEEVTMTDASPIWSLYGAMRAGGYVVAMNGDGADELLGGYVHHTDYALRSSGGLLRSPLRFRDLVETRYHLPGENGPLARSSRSLIARRSDPVLRALLSPARALRRRFAAQTIPSGLRRDAVLRATVAAPPQTMRQEALAAGLSPLNAFLYEEFHATKLPGILRMFDRAAMAHGVEIRNPFLDWRLVGDAFGLPDDAKIGGGFSKRILREAMRGLVPDTVRLRRQKLGFNAPLPQWFAGPLASWLWELVNEAAFLDSDLWDGRAIRAFIGDKRAAGAWNWGDGEAIWPFIHAHLWRRYVLGRAPLP